MSKTIKTPRGDAYTYQEGTRDCKVAHEYHRLDVSLLTYPPQEVWRCIKCDQEIAIPQKEQKPQIMVINCLLKG